MRSCPPTGAHDMRGAIARLATAAKAARPPHAVAAAATTHWPATAAACSPPTFSSTSSSLLFFPGRGSHLPTTTATRATSSSSASSSSSSSSAPSSSAIENLAAAAPKRPPRFFVEPEQLSQAASSSSGGAVVALPASEARHARKVLRLRPGAPLELCDGRGRIARAVLLEQQETATTTSSSRSDLSADTWARIEGPVSVLPVPLPRLSLAVAALGLKGGRGDWLVEKAAELGAAALVPLATERSPAAASGKDFDDEEEEEEEAASSHRRSRRQQRRSPSSSSSPTSARSARWRRLAEAAGKQCLRPHALAVERAATVAELAERIRNGLASSASSSSSCSQPCLALVAAEGAPPVAEVLSGLLREQQQQQQQQEQEQQGENKKIELVYLVVGPEGDFTPRELEVLLEAGARPVGLGSNRLRVETAAEALLAVAGAMLG